MRIKLLGLVVVGLVALGACIPGGGGLFTRFIFDHEDNDSLEAAQLAGPLLPGDDVTIRGTVAQGDGDWFRFTLPPGTHTVRLNCTPDFEDTPVVFTDLYDTSGNFLGGSACTDGEPTDADGLSGTIILNVGLQTTPFRPPVDYEARLWVDPAD